MTVVRSCVLPGNRHDELPADAYTCTACQRGLVRRLAAIETYLDVLRIIGAAPLRSGGHGPVSRQYESREPLRLDVLAMLSARTVINGDGPDDRLDEIPNVWADLSGWSAIVREEHPDHPAGSGPWYLRAWCGWICQQPWVDEFAESMACLHAALRRACRDDPGKPQGTCLDQACLGDVYRRSDDPTDPRLRCARCRVSYDGLDLARIHYGGIPVSATIVIALLHREAAAKNRPELAVTAAALWQWRRRGHIGPGPGYDMAEIIAYVDRRAQLDAQVKAVS